MDIRPPLRRIEVSHRRLLLLAIPMTLAHVTTPLLGLVDATVIGRLGEAHLLGAVALGAVIFDFVFWSFGALRMSTAGLTAQATGAGDDREVDIALARALVIAGLIGLALIALQWPLAAVAFPLAGASESVTQALGVYFGLRIWAAPFTLANYAILGSTLGRGRTDVGLLLQVAINVVNIALTSLFVLGLGYGIAGAAVGTALAEMVGTALGLLALRRLGSRPFRVGRARVFDRAAMLRTLAVNRDVMIRTMALMLAFAVFTAKGARAGDVTLAANAVLYNMFLVGSYFLDGFATAAETLCGQSVGARDETAFRRAVRLSVGWSIGFGLAASMILLVGGAHFIDFVSTNLEVRAFARQYLPFAALTPLFGAAAFAFDGIYAGATWTAAMRNLMLAALAAFAAFVSVAGSLGNTGLWIALLIFLSTRGLGQALLAPRLTRRTFGGLERV
ncbi:MATE family efflux transporter [Microvirga pudoricolor]|uniref:MATE family efflux transporter n=1 Tax=Microvirga pudoricolor TaxID=2778729 RepID=UPI001950E7CF|nr:MATE family efflux transporter [Microvirga pudoricolor]MBM6592934.1 MATE family efflux transporter [Microvirga pudoricolor]